MGIEELRGIPLFRGLSDDLLSFLVPIVHEENYEPDSGIFEEGAASDRFFVIRQGEVEIRKETDKKEGKFKLIAVLVSGEFFGEMGVFMNQPRTARAVAKTQVSLISVSRDDLTSLFSKSPDAAFTMMGFLSSVLMERLHNTTKELATVYETGRLVTTARSMEELTDYVMEGLLGALDTADAGLFVLWNEFNMDFEAVAQRGLEIEPFTELPEADPVLLLLSGTHEPFISFDIENDTRLDLGEGNMYAGKSMIAAPFFLHDRMLGFMAVMSRGQTSAFSYNHMVLLSAISGYVSVAIENLKYMQEAVDRARLSQAKSSIQPF